MYTVNLCLHGSSVMVVLAAACLVWQPGLASEKELSVVPQLGRTPPPGYLAAQPVHAFADGRGLPEGSGTVEEGAVIFKAQCAGCHGNKGQGGSAMELVGDRSLLATEFPDKGIAVYWPYAPPLFNYIQRAMPPDKPWSLNASQTYAVIAHLLSISGLVPAGQSVDAGFLSGLVMPNRNGFNNLAPD